jgi:hypothetical protein
MSEINTIILFPFLAAFLLSVVRFYVRDNARSIFLPSFLVAVGSVLIAVLYLVLGTLGFLPEHGVIEFGVVGVALLGFAIYRMMQF